MTETDLARELLLRAIWAGLEVPTDDDGNYILDDIPLVRAQFEGLVDAALAAQRKAGREAAADKCAAEAAELRKADLSILTPCAKRIHVACIGLASALAAAIRALPDTGGEGEG